MSALPRPSGPPSETPSEDHPPVARQRARSENLDVRWRNVAAGGNTPSCQTNSPSNAFIQTDLQGPSETAEGPQVATGASSTTQTTPKRNSATMAHAATTQIEEMTATLERMTATLQGLPDETDANKLSALRAAVQAVSSAVNQKTRVDRWRQDLESPCPRSSQGLPPSPASQRRPPLYTSSPASRTQPRRPSHPA